MKRAVLLPLLFLSLLGFTQEFTWVKSDGSYGDDRIMSCAVDAQGDYLFAGMFTDSIRLSQSILLKSNGKADFYLLKTNSLGEPIWAVCGGGGSFSSEAVGVDTDAQGNIYVAGYFTDTLKIGATEIYGYKDGKKDGFIAKLTPTGELVWLKTVVGPNDDQFETIEVAGSTIYASGRFKLSLTIDGVTFQSEDSNVGENINPFVVSMSTDGTMNWINKVDCQSGFARAISLAANGYLYVGFELKGTPFLRTVGTSYVQPLKQSNSSTADNYIVALNSQTGAQIWANRMSSNRSEMLYALTSDENSNVLLGGIFQSTVKLESTDGNSATATSKGNFDFYLCKYDASGKLLWSDFQGGTESDVLTSIAVGKNGYIYLTGYFSSSTIQMGNVTVEAALNNINSLILRYTPDGVPSWAKVASSINSSFYLNAITYAGEGELILCGSYKGQGTFFEGTALLNEFTTSNVVFSRLSDKTVSVDPVNANGLTVDVYPLPANQLLYFRTPDNVTVSRIRVFNLIGQEMLSVVPQSASLSVGGLRPGIYLASFTIGNRVITKKIVVNR
ncbi:MAG: T9SS type A sorting domain-containing protein [Tenuifilaceae bacterium]|nr:T9SS type A sorting domain-containing protein [Tenuifilaceae bacterium]